MMIDWNLREILSMQFFLQFDYVIVVNKNKTYLLSYKIKFEFVSNETRWK